MAQRTTEDPAEAAAVRDHHRLARFWAWRTARRYPRLDFDDLLQAALVGLLVGHRTYDPSGGRTYSAWLSVCIRARAWSHVKRELGFLDRQRAAGDATKGVPARPDSSRHMAEGAEAYRALTGGLPATQRAALDAVHLRGERAADYARRVGVSPQAINGRLAGAYRRLALRVGAETSVPRRATGALARGL